MGIISLEQYEKLSDEDRLKIQKKYEKTLKIRRIFDPKSLDQDFEKEEKKRRKRRRRLLKQKRMEKRIERKQKKK